MSELDEEQKFIANITLNVLEILLREKFFERLDEAFGSDKNRCKHSYDTTLEVLNVLGFNADDKNDILQVLHASGGHCDCEILFNVAENSRIKSTYWKSRATHSSSSGKLKSGL